MENEELFSLPSSSNETPIVDSLPNSSSSIPIEKENIIYHKDEFFVFSSDSFKETNATENADLTRIRSSSINNGHGGNGGGSNTLMINGNNRLLKSPSNLASQRSLSPVRANSNNTNNVNQDDMVDVPLSPHDSVRFNYHESPTVNNSKMSKTTTTTTKNEIIQTINYIPKGEESKDFISSTTTTTTSNLNRSNELGNSNAAIYTGGSLNDSVTGSRNDSKPYIPPIELCKEIDEKSHTDQLSTMTKREKKKDKKLEKEIKEALQEQQEKKDDIERKLMKKKRRKIRRKRRLHLEHKKNSLGETIFKGHPSWLLMRTIQTGILNCISKTSHQSIQENSDQFFSSLHHVLPVIEGQPGTFTFKDYCPHAFSRLRELFNIDPQSYIYSLCKPWNEVSTPGKSGSIFFFSYDNQYVLKTIPKREAKLLRSLLPEYYEHMKRNPNSLLTRFFGLHRVKPKNGRQVRFLVMKNLFCTPKQLTMRFDLKGSTVGRELSPEELKKKNPTYKDMDFRRIGMKIHLGPDRKKLFIHQLSEDCKFLVKLNIMDYSLLIGVHRKEDLPPVVPPSPSAFDDEMMSSSGDDYSDDSSSDDEDGRNELRASRRIRSIAQTKQYFQQQQQQQQQLQQQSLQQHLAHSHVQNNINDAPSQLQRKTSEYMKPLETNNLPPLLPNTSSPIPLIKPKISIFEHDKGGMQGIDETGNPLSEYYFMGIIDILMLYSFRKQIEHTYKSLFNRGEVSSVDPVEYAARFINFVREQII